MSDMIFLRGKECKIIGGIGTPTGGFQLQNVSVCRFLSSKSVKFFFEDALTNA
jgi:hypothetical protein